MARREYTYMAKVVDVIDGDTVRLDIDLGLYMHSVQSVRLHGVNTPEKNQAGGAEATTALRGLLPVGSEVELKTQKPDKYGRVLGQIKAAGININHRMLDYGEAYYGGKR